MLSHKYYLIYSLVTYSISNQTRNLRFNLLVVVIFLLYLTFLSHNILRLCVSIISRYTDSQGVLTPSINSIAWHKNEKVSKNIDASTFIFEKYTKRPRLVVTYLLGKKHHRSRIDYRHFCK